MNKICMKIGVILLGIMGMLGVLVIIWVFLTFVMPVSYHMVYSEYEDNYKYEYDVNNVIFSSGISDYQDRAFTPNREGFNRGLFSLWAKMEEPYDVTVNSYDIYLVYRDKEVFLSRAEINKKMVFQESNYTEPHYSSVAVSEKFYIPDSDLKKVKGVRVAANVTVSNGNESVTEDMEFEYKAKYEGFPLASSV